MSASDIDRNKKICRTLLIYTGIAAFCILFSAVYEHFSHGVYSPYMVYLFLIPLAGGLLPSLTLLLLRSIPYPGPFVRCFYNSGISVLTVGSCIKGVFEIYGTDSAYISYYLYWGLAFVSVSLIIYAVSSISNRKSKM